MNRAELVDAMAKEAGLSKADTEKVESDEQNCAKGKDGFHAGQVHSRASGGLSARTRYVSDSPQARRQLC